MLQLLKNDSGNKNCFAFCEITERRRTQALKAQWQNIRSLMDSKVRFPAIFNNIDEWDNDVWREDATAKTKAKE